jgi:hypothetical protein
VASNCAARTEIVGLDKWRHALHVKIAALRTRGEANDELVRFLSEKLGLRRGDIRIQKGERSARKLIYLPVSAQEASRRLGVK